jgi:hypothetical protein
MQNPTTPMPSIEMVPKSACKEGHYVAMGEWNISGGYEENPDKTKEDKRVRIGCGGLQRSERAQIAFPG